MAYSIRYHYRRSSFVSLLLMRNFLNDDGPLNGLLQTFHITNGPLPFLTDPLWAKFSIIFVNMWIGIPFTMLVATGITLIFLKIQITIQPWRLGTQKVTYFVLIKMGSYNLIWLKS